MYLFLSLNLTKNSRVETKYLIQLSTPTLYAIRTAFYWQICHIFDLVTLKSTPSETCPNTLCWTWWWWHRVSVRLLRLVKITFQMSFFFIISLWFCTRLPCCLPHALTAFYSEHKKIERHSLTVLPREEMTVLCKAQFSIPWKVRSIK